MRRSTPAVTSYQVSNQKQLQARPFMHMLHLKPACWLCRCSMTYNPGTTLVNAKALFRASMPPSLYRLLCLRSTAWPDLSSRQVDRLCILALVVWQYLHLWAMESGLVS